MEQGTESLGDSTFRFASAGPSSSTSGQPLSLPDKPWSSAPTDNVALPNATEQSTHSDSSTSQPDTTSSTAASTRRAGGKPNVLSACGPCKRSHLACDVARPCQRCLTTDKPEQCVDIPHKKRGRPKTTRSTYYRISDGGMPSTRGAFSGRRLYGPPGLPQDLYVPPYPPYPPYPPPSEGAYSTFGFSERSPYATRSQSPLHSTSESSMRGHAPPTPPLPFELFCTMDLRIARVAARSQQFTGYMPHQFLGVCLLDFVHPADRVRVEHELCMLTTISFVNSSLQTSPQAAELMCHRSEQDLLSPTEGMKEPYPSAKVRIIRADNTFAWFDIRLHLGGGLGASLYQPNSLGNIYIVASFLYLTHFEEAGRGPFWPLIPLSAPNESGPKPTTAMVPSYATGESGRNLPSFSSLAAAAVPRLKYEWPEYPGIGSTEANQPTASSSLPNSFNNAKRSTYEWANPSGYVKREVSPLDDRMQTNDYARRMPQQRQDSPYESDQKQFPYNLPSHPHDQHNGYRRVSAVDAHSREVPR